jgi:branched-chain amino acid transport system permease protein
MWAAVIGAFIVMVMVGLATEKLVLRKLVNQPPISLFMATIGLSFFLDGLGPMLFGSEVRAIDLGIVDEPIESIMNATGIGISKFDLFASGMVILLVAALTLFFQKTKVGRALRAVADDHQAALSLGIPLQHIWAIVWGVAGFVALVAGLLWGSRNGVQFALTMTALKALPVLILGGFTSVPGAIVGGLIIGASEKLAEIYIPPVLQDAFGGNFGGIEGWFPYVFALLFLLVRPEGLFGEKHIDRV